MNPAIPQHAVKYSSSVAFVPQVAGFQRAPAQIKGLKEAI
jgi:hypothetical protein